MKAVIQAGGRGARLRPYTFVVPKPMMPVGEQPVIEVLLKWLRRWDVTETYITTGYLGHLIRALCGDGSQWGMVIKYSEEFEPLGTVGSLTKLKEYLTDTFLVLNGDLITDLDLNAFTRFHKQNSCQLSIACAQKTVKIDFGVIEELGCQVTAFKEKPNILFHVSMGVYCMEPSVIDFIPSGVPFGFDNLMHTMLAREIPVCLYKHSGIWMDIGHEKDFCHVQEHFTRDYRPLILGC
ncbi:MAG: nucleotidyltransferase family protein [Nitrososphaera sp.]